MSDGLNLNDIEKLLQLTYRGAHNSFAGAKNTFEKSSKSSKQERENYVSEYCEILNKNKGKIAKSETIQNKHLERYIYSVLRNKGSERAAENFDVSISSIRGSISFIKKIIKNDIPELQKLEKRFQENPSTFAEQFSAPHSQKHGDNNCNPCKPQLSEQFSIIPTLVGIENQKS